MVCKLWGWFGVLLVSFYATQNYFRRKIADNKMCLQFNRHTLICTHEDHFNVANPWKPLLHKDLQSSYKIAHYEFVNMKT